MSQANFVSHASSDTFSHLVLQAPADVLVLVDFWASWCGPCQMLSPILDKLAVSYAGKISVVKINTDEEQQLAIDYGVRSLPTVKLFRGGQIVDEFLGAQTESAVRQIIDRHIEKPSDHIRTQAQTHIDAGEYDQAIALLTDLIHAQPDERSLLLDLSHAHLAKGDLKTCQQTFAQVPLELKSTDAAKLIAAKLDFASALVDAPTADVLQQTVTEQPQDLRARYLLGVHQIVAGNYEQGLEQFLELLRRDRHFEDGLARKSLVSAFELIDNRSLVNRYRQRMAALMF